MTDRWDDRWLNKSVYSSPEDDASREGGGAEREREGKGWTWICQHRWLTRLLSRIRFDLLFRRRSHFGVSLFETLYNDSKTTGVKRGRMLGESVNAQGSIDERVEGGTMGKRKKEKERSSGRKKEWEGSSGKFKGKDRLLLTVIDGSILRIDSVSFSHFSFR